MACFICQGWAASSRTRWRESLSQRSRWRACATREPRLDVHVHREKYGIPQPEEGHVLQLDDLRENLVRQEETIIFSMVERAQFAKNEVIYDPKKLPVPGFDGCFSQYLLFELEKVYSKVRRYTSPDEHPFSKDLLQPTLLELLQYPKTIIVNNVNINDRIWQTYLERIIPGICTETDDSNYGSSATCDVMCLQALSKRIHYGKFVAEAKFQENPEKYTQLIRAGDTQGIWDELTNLKVEKLLLRRVFNKAKAYVQDITCDGTLESYKVQPEMLVNLYRDIIIPFTKDVEVEYLMVRA